MHRPYQPGISCNGYKIWSFSLFCLLLSSQVMAQTLWAGQPAWSYNPASAYLSDFIGCHNLVLALALTPTPIILGNFCSCAVSARLCHRNTLSFSQYRPQGSSCSVLSLSVVVRKGVFNSSAWHFVLQEVRLYHYYESVQSFGLIGPFGSWVQWWHPTTIIKLKNVSSWEWVSAPSPSWPGTRCIAESNYTLLILLLLPLKDCYDYRCMWHWGLPACYKSRFTNWAIASALVSKKKHTVKKEYVSC